MRTKLFFVTLLLLHFSIVKAQDFDEEIEKTVQSMADQLNKKGPIQIAIYPFRFNKPNEKVLAEYITDEFWLEMPNKSITYEVMDRTTFDAYFEEHRLNSEGLIDPTTEKAFGMLIAADAYVTGKAYVFNSVIKLKVSATDTQTGKILATASKKLPITYDIAEYMGLKGWEEKKRESDKYKSTNPDCSRRGLGDFCFQNDSPVYLRISIRDLGTLSSTYRNITVAPKKFGCFKDLPAKGYGYSVHKYVVGVGGTTIDTGLEGNFYVIKCQSSSIKLK